MSWYEKYKDLIPLPINADVFQKHLMEMMPFTYAIKRCALQVFDNGTPPVFLEVGCGPALVSRVMSVIYPSSEFHLMDSDPDIVRDLRVAMKSKLAKVFRDDATNMKFQGPVDIVFHHRLLDTFQTSQQVMDVLEAQKKIAKMIVFDVRLQGNKDQWDGRTWIVDDWLAMIKMAGLVVPEYGLFGLNHARNEGYFVCLT